jgi:hypothetical protein
VKIEQSRNDVQTSKNGVSRTIYQLTATGAKSQEYSVQVPCQHSISGGDAGRADLGQRRNATLDCQFVALVALSLVVIDSSARDIPLIPVVVQVAAAAGSA